MLGMLWLCGANLARTGRQTTLRHVRRDFGLQVHSMAPTYDLSGLIWV